MTSHEPVNYSFTARYSALNYHPGSLNRANPELSEDVTLIRAMRDSNIPKFLQDDVILFQVMAAPLIYP